MSFCNISSDGGLDAADRGLQPPLALPWRHHWQKNYHNVFDGIIGDYSGAIAQGSFEHFWAKAKSFFQLIGQKFSLEEIGYLCIELSVMSSRKSVGDFVTNKGFLRIFWWIFLTIK